MRNLFVVLAVILLSAVVQSFTIQAQAGEQDGTYFIDVHKLEPGGVTYADVVNAHKKDLEMQDKYGVSFITFWVDESKGVVYCLSKAEDSDHVHSTHEEAHGLVPNEIYNVVAGEQEKYTGNGHLFLDIHDIGPGNVTSEAVAEAHMKDLEVQGKHGVNFINYWVDAEQGKVFCLSEAPDAESVATTHEHAHGLVPQTVLMVIQGQ